ncbi:DNA adenine methylase [Clostridiaceae bacterium HSG29]|nr:DNA adenine methylase [Clostridiaceae bacterium HSG29]
MWYLGGKIRLSKYIVPIIKYYIKSENSLFIDLFCGGCNIIDKIDNTNNKIANDNNKYLISMWNNIDKVDLSEIKITKEHYDEVRNNKDYYEDWYVGFIGFHFSYGGKFFGGFARSRYEDHIERSCTKTIKQYEYLKNVYFSHQDYKYYSNVKDAVIYCDSPYDNCTQKSTKYLSSFDHREFWEWVRKMSKYNTVLISEKIAPDDFEVIWEKSHNSNMSYIKSDKTSEKLFKYKRS